MNLFGRAKATKKDTSVIPEYLKGAVKSRSEVPKNAASTMTMSEFTDFVTGGLNAGVAVNEKTAMAVSAVYASVGLIGGAIASIPLQVYKITEEGRERVSGDLWWLLNRQPNNNYSAAVFREALVGSLLMHGDGFAKIIRPSRFSPDVSGFDWYKKKEVEVVQDGDRLIYLLTRDNKTTAVAQEDMLHIPGPGFDGKNGMSQLKYVLLNAAGIAIASDKYSSAFFENGARPDFALEFPGDLDEEQQAMIRTTWAKRYQGPGNAHLPALLTDGAKVHELTMSSEDAQLLTTRQFQVEDIARIFGVPPHMIGHTSKSTSWGTGVEQMSIGFVKYTLNRHLTKIEQELNRKLWPNDRTHYVEFNTAGLERGDYKTRMEGYRIAIGRAGEPGWVTPEEVRILENLPAEPKVGSLNKGMGNESTAEATGTE